MIWTDEYTAEFRRLVETGISYSEIALRLNARFDTNITRNACIGKANRLGLQRAENRYSGMSAADRKRRAIENKTARNRRRNVERKAARWAAKPWLAEVSERSRERDATSKLIRANCASKTSPTYRNHLPRLPEMTKGELRMMLRQAVENTALSQ